jgi:hypothetical protein
MAKPAEEFYVESSEGRQGPFTDMQGARSRARAIAHGGKLAKVYPTASSRSRGRDIRRRIDYVRLDY